MLSQLKSITKGLLERVGLDVRTVRSASRFQTRMRRQLNAQGIDLVFDVGANVGQYGAELYAGGYRGATVSFEPLPAPYAELLVRAARQPGWRVHARCALGDADGEVQMHVSANSVSSSILDIQPAHLHSAPAAASIGHALVPLRRLDSIVGEYLPLGAHPFLKMDAQGFEWQVLDGAEKTLASIRGIQTEVSLVELYAGQKLYREMIERIEGLGFSLWTMDPGFCDLATGRTLQCDLVFFRN